MLNPVRPTSSSVTSKVKVEQDASRSSESDKHTISISAQPLGMDAASALIVGGMASAFFDQHLSTIDGLLTGLAAVRKGVESTPSISPLALELAGDLRGQLAQDTQSQVQLLLPATAGDGFRRQQLMSVLFF